MENPTRRRVLAAGLTGTALGLIGGRDALAGTTPPSEGTTGEEPSPAADESTTSESPELPTAADVPLLGFAQSVELAARDLYQRALDAGVEDDVVTVMRDNHRAFAEVIAGLLGVNAPGERDDAMYEELSAAFDQTDVAALAADAYDFESAAVATHIELVGSLEGLHGAQLIASIVTVESQHCAVLALLSGAEDDFDRLFVNDAEPLPVPSSSGG